MAADFTGQPWIMDTATDTSPDDVPVEISTIIFDAGAAGGTYDVHDADGRSLTGIHVLGADEWIQIVVHQRVKGGITLDAIGDGQVLVYHGTV